MRLLGKIIGAVIILALVSVIAILLLSWFSPETVSDDVDSAIAAMQAGAHVVVDEGKKVMEEGKKVIDTAAEQLPEVAEAAKEGLDNTIDSAKERITGAQETPNGSKLTPEQAKARIDANSKIILLDVRTQQEYNERHLPRAKLLPLDDIAEKAETALPDKDAEILVYCRTGVRSASAAKKLVDMGYARVYNIGGIIDWPYDE